MGVSEANLSLQMLPLDSHDLHLLMAQVLVLREKAASLEEENAMARLKATDRSAVERNSRPVPG
jgi:hypothetical protein